MMSKRKNASCSQPPNGPKKAKLDNSMEPVKINLLDDSHSEKGSDEENKKREPRLKINEDYAKKFEHNRKREELHRC